MKTAPQTKRHKGRSSFRWILLSLVPIVGLSVGVFYYQIKTWLWHASHANTVSILEWEVPIPKGWLPEIEYGTLLILRVPVLSTPGNRSLVWIEPTTPYDTQYTKDTWKEEMESYMKKMGYTVTGNRDLLVSGRDTRCIEADVSTKRRRVPSSTVRCHNAALFVTFFGRREDLHTFYAIISGIRESRKG